MSSPSASATKKRSESNEQAQPSLKNLTVKPQSGTGANIVLIGAPGSGKVFFIKIKYSKPIGYYF
jgi:ABC-type polysaccharide/polyol phosphate transport system ATPase subunit